MLAPLSVLAVWTKNTLLNEDQYVSTVAPLAKNPAIIDAVATDIANSLGSQKNIEAQIKDALPSRADFIAPAVAGSLKNVVHELAVKVAQLRSIRGAVGAGEPPRPRSGRRRAHREQRPHGDHPQR